MAAAETSPVRDSSISLRVFDFHARENREHLFKLLHYSSDHCGPISTEIESATHIRVDFSGVEKKFHSRFCKILDHIPSETTTLALSCNMVTGSPVRIPGHIKYLCLSFSYSDHVEFRNMIDNLPVSLEALSIVKPITLRNPPPLLKFINIALTRVDESDFLRIATDYFETIPSLEVVRFGYNFYSLSASSLDAYSLDTYSTLYTRDVLK